MSFLLQRLRHHETACEAAVREGNFADAARHAAQAAEYSVSLAETAGEGPLAARYATEAENWLSLAEKISEQKRQKSEVRAQTHASSSPIRDSSSPPAESDSEWLISEKPSITFDKIAGMQEAKQAIREMILAPLANVEAARKLGIQAGGGILLYGPPGNGKTLIGKAIACEIDAPFYYASGAQIRSKWHGESEQRLRQLFTQAKSQPLAVLFLDEIDGLIPRRSSGGSAVDTRIVNQFLAEIGGFEDSPNSLLLLGATNKPWDIDDAAFRTGRLDRKIYIPPPDREARRAILRIHLGEAPADPTIDWDAWADRLENYTGSDLAGLLSAAKRRALTRAIDTCGEPLLAPEDIETTLPTIYPSAHAKVLQQFEKFTRERG
jgi:transitional endoplasmic reticulum ATPase